MSIIDAIKDSINDIIRLVPQEKRENASPDSIFDSLDTLDNELENLKDENIILKSKIEAMHQDAQFQDRFLVAYHADDASFEDDVPFFEDLDNSISLLDAKIKEQTDSMQKFDLENEPNVISPNDVDNLLEPFKEATNKQEETIKALTQQNSEIVDQFEQLFGKDADIILDDAEMENAQLRQTIKKMQEDYKKYKMVYDYFENKYGYRFTKDPISFVKTLDEEQSKDENLTSFVRELAAIFNFADEIKEGSINAQHPFYSGSYCTRLVQHIRSLIGAETIRAQLQNIKDKYHLLVKRYKQIRFENVASRKEIAKIAGIDTTDMSIPLHAFVLQMFTRVVRVCANRSSSVLENTIQKMEHNFDDITTKIDDCYAKMSQVTLAFTLMCLKVGTQQSDMNENAAVNSQQLFDAIFPVHMNVTPFSSNEVIQSSISQMNSLVDKIFSDLNARSPSSACLMTRLAAMRRAIRNYSLSVSASANSTLLSMSSI